VHSLHNISYAGPSQLLYILISDCVLYHQHINLLKQFGVTKTLVKYRLCLLSNLLCYFILLMLRYSAVCKMLSYLLYG